MRQTSIHVVAALGLIAGLSGTHAWAQKSGGTLHLTTIDNPPSASVHEESTVNTNDAFAPIFNNLIQFDPAKPRTSAETIVADLATDWKWNADNTSITFKLRSGVKWHDGKPFTSADVKCTWDTLSGKRQAGWRKNPREQWYTNLKEVVVNGDTEVTFNLNKPQPAFMMYLASGFSAVYPCHLDGRVMRQSPIGTGPFKLVEYRPNQHVKLVRNPEYFRQGRPYLDGIEISLAVNRATSQLSFLNGELSVIGATGAFLPDVKKQLPTAQCVMRAHNSQTLLLLNHTAPPFDDAELRKAAILAVDRKAIAQSLSYGEGTQGGVMLTPPYGIWGLSAEQLAKLPGFGDIDKSREESKKILAKYGYGPGKPLKLTIHTRDTPAYRDAAVLVIDHLRRVNIEADLKALESSLWYGVLGKKQFTLAVGVNGVAVDDPDAVLYEAVSCGSDRNYAGYCNKEVDAMIERQSTISDSAARKKLVNEIDIKLQQDLARPVLFNYVRALCAQGNVKGFSPAINSNYGHNRYENAWLDGPSRK